MTPTPGQVAYAAYLQRFVAYQHHTSGTVMPQPWASLPLLVQMCWEVAADAVLDAPDAPPPTPGQVVIDRDFFAHLLTCLANQKFLHEMAGSLNWENRQQAKDIQASIDVAWRRGMDLLQSPDAQR